jgi:hypothetical protein
MTSRGITTTGITTKRMTIKGITTNDEQEFLVLDYREDFGPECFDARVGF